MKNSCMIFIDILLLIGVVYLFSCNGNRTTYSDNSKTHAEYNINYYVDTIYGHVILSTVVDKYNSLSVSSIEIDNFSKIDND